MAIRILLVKEQPVVGQSIEGVVLADPTGQFTLNKAITTSPVEIINGDVYAQCVVRTASGTQYQLVHAHVALKGISEVLCR